MKRQPGTRTRGQTGTVPRRVLADGHRAVLAVDDTLRYGPLKAGYHGGASAAEVVVPVAVLLPDESANTAKLALLPPQVPTWWLTSRPVTPMPTPAVNVARSGSEVELTVREGGATLFDLEPAAPAASAAQPATPAAAPPAPTLGRAIVTSAVYKGQRKMAGRLIVRDDQIAALVDGLAAANATRLPPVLVAQALGVGQTQLRGALSQVRQLLNVEGYAVLAEDAATGVVILDAGLLREQFEVRS